MQVRESCAHRLTSVGTGVALTGGTWPFRRRQPREPPHPLRRLPLKPHLERRVPRRLVERQRLFGEPVGVVGHVRVPDEEPELVDLPAPDRLGVPELVERPPLDW